MKDNQQIVSLEVTSPNTTAQKSVSPVAMETDLSTLAVQNGDTNADSNGDTNGEANGLIEESINLSLTEEENSDKIQEESELAPAKVLSTETEDEILNKFDTNDTLMTDIIAQKLEDKLLDDSDDFETEANHLNGLDEIAQEPEVKTISNEDETVAGVLDNCDAIKDIVQDPIEAVSNDCDAIPDVLDDAPNDLDAVKDVSNDTPVVTDVSNGPTAVADVSNDLAVVADLSNGPTVVADVSNDLAVVADLSNGLTTVADVSNDSAVVADVSNGLTEVADISNDIPVVADVSNDLDVVNDAPLDLDAVTGVTNEQPIVENGHSVDDIEAPVIPDEMIAKEDGSVVTDQNSVSVESDDKTKEEQDAELLKDQIMDTEDLLQILEDVQTETETDLDHDPDVMDHDEESDSDKPIDTDVNDELEEFDSSEHITTDDDQVIKEGSDAKDVGEADVEAEDVLISESDVISDAAISNENSSSGDKDEGLLIDDKSDLSDEKECEMVEVGDVSLEREASSPAVETETMDVDDDTTKPVEEIQTKTTKRTLSDSESETETKKIKLVEDTKLEDAKVTEDPVQKLKALNLFSDYMRSKNLKKLTRVDLEQFCLQKMCEAIYHKSEIGELRHQLGVQEQMVEMWRKEVVQLSKQARDLEIVNKRLLHEVRLKNERDKPLIPVKITRSVGLQVRSDGMINMITPKRRPSRPQPTNVVHTIAPKPVNKPPVPPLAKPAPTIPNASKTAKVITPKANALLTQALANSAASNAANNAILNALNKSPVKSVTASTPLRVIPVKSSAVQKNVLPKVTAVITPTHSTKPIDKTFIDLTDEEEKRPQTVSLQTVTTATTTGVRLVKTGTSVVTTTNSVANSPRIMYVYNNQLHQGVLATDPTKPGGQKLMLKLNSNMMGQANGVLTTVPSGSLSVGGTPLRPGQPVRLTAPVAAVRSTLTATKSVLRHPAPLPPPPVSQLSIAARKPIPPRPHLTIRRSSGGIVLSWKMPYNLDNYEAIASYQLYAYQETSALPCSDMWRKVGDVKALALPMACTLTQFADGNKYHFAVRAVDVHKRMGQFSEPEQILL